MDKKTSDKLVKNGARAGVDSKNVQQPRRVIASNGKLRIQVGAPKWQNK